MKVRDNELLLNRIKKDKELQMNANKLKTLNREDKNYYANKSRICTELKKEWKKSKDKKGNEQSKLGRRHSNKR